MKSLMLLWQVAADELAARCGTSTSRDFKTVTSRVEHEGLSFLTMTLPDFGKSFEKSLSRGRVDHDLFQGFSFGGGLPRFLGGFLGLVFDRATGRLKDDPDVEAIYAIRQLTLMFGKILLAPSKERVNATIRGFVEIEQEVKRADARRTASEEAEFRQVSTLLWGDVLSRVNKDLYDEHRGPAGNNPGWPFVIPKHGPGATADRLAGNRKFDQVEWPRRLEEVFPSGDYLLPNWRYYYRLDRVNFLEPGAERPVRVTAVPKTLKAPRLIAIEPTAMQYMQQAVKSLLVNAIESDPLMRWFVGFTDQTPNRDMACEGSLTGNLATLDLSEASDRVSNQLVRAMLKRYGLVFEAVDATRSRKADVPGHGVIRLAKFASMGSALTFPIEAMVFATLVFLGIQDTLRRPLTRRDLKVLKGQVRVYGDDIIVPVDYVPAVVSRLENFGFRVNASKSFWSGHFRESCGREYYAGEDVSIVRVRMVTDQAEFPTQLRHVREIESFVALRNKFYLSGLWRTASWCDARIDPLLKGRYPTIAVRDCSPEEEASSRSRLLGRWSFLGYQTERTHPTLHAPLVRGYVVSHRIPESRLSGEGALLKVLLKQGEEPFADSKHLERAGRPDAVSIKLRWAQPY